MKFTPQINWLFLITCFFYCANAMQLNAESAIPLNDDIPIIVFPNPNSGYFIINYNFPANSSGNDYSLTVFNTTGDKVYSNNIININNMDLIHVEFLSAGVYFLELTDGDTPCIKKILITN